MKIKSLLIAFFFFLVIKQVAFGATVETLQIPSKSMNKDVEVVVITPDKQKITPPSGGWGVIYLLHGYGGNAKTWIGIKPNLPEIADQYGIMFVCPDGKNSWYWDSPENPSYRYETFVAKELVEYIDTNYSTIKERTKRAITGLSMGGHGGMWISIRHKDVFGAAGSTSGGLDIRPFPGNWEMSTQLGEKSVKPDIWEKHTVINQLDQLKNGELAIIIDCGYDDFFLGVNHAFHDELMKRKIDHDYLLRPGGHDNNYWRNSIDYQILFFVKYFSR